MKNSKFRPLLILLAAASLAAPLAAQNQMKPPRQQRSRKTWPPCAWSALTQALDLTEDQTAKVFPILNRIEKDKQDMQKNLSQDVRPCAGWARIPKPRTPPSRDDCSNPSGRPDPDQSPGRRRGRRPGDSLTVRQKARYEIFQIDFLRGLERDHEPGPAADGAKRRRRRAPVKK